MSPTPLPLAELLDEQAATLDELAHACAAEPGWVVERVQLGVLQCSAGRGTDAEAGTDAAAPGAQAAWRFSAHTLVRARRIAELERMFEADPQLAALAVDLIEEVHQLRQRLRRLGG